MARFPTIARCSRVAAPLLALLLGGCFHPLYGTAIPGADTVGTELRAIAVDPIPDRVGHYLGNELAFQLNGTGDAVPPKYHLLVTIRQSVQTALVDTLEARATSGTLVSYADYRLVPAAGGDPVTTGTVVSTASYDRSQERYANIRAARDAEIRNAHTLADLIKTRIAAALVPKS